MGSASNDDSNHSTNVNLIYIRAAIEDNTGVRLSLTRIRELLVEEGLLDPQIATKQAQIFTGYEEFYDPVLPSHLSNEDLTSEIDLNEDC